MKADKLQIGILDVIQIVFIILKFLKLIDWGWGWVLCPLWFSLILAVIVATIEWFIGEDDDNEV